MGLHIKDPETARLVCEPAKETGESITTAVATAVQELLRRVRGARSTGLKEELGRIAELSTGLPALDDLVRRS
jgi:hypothetical protein